MLFQSVKNMCLHWILPPIPGTTPYMNPACGTSRSRRNAMTTSSTKTSGTPYCPLYGILRIVAEDVNVNNHFRDMRKLSEFRGILLEVCDELSLPEPEFVNVASLKKWATGNGKAGKTDMVQACIDKYRYTPIDDNAADACHLFHYYVRKYRIM